MQATMIVMIVVMVMGVSKRPSGSLASEEQHPVSGGLRERRLSANKTPLWQETLSGIIESATRVARPA